jgi:hypothetical protein
VKKQAHCPRDQSPGLGKTRQGGKRTMCMQTREDGDAKKNQGRKEATAWCRGPGRGAEGWDAR